MSKTKKDGAFGIWWISSVTDVAGPKMGYGTAAGLAGKSVYGVDEKTREKSFDDLKPYLTEELIKKWSENEQETPESVQEIDDVKLRTSGQNWRQSINDWPLGPWRV